jgi:hypothetical protein
MKFVYRRGDVSGGAAALTGAATVVVGAMSTFTFEFLRNALSWGGVINICKDILFKNKFFLNDV